MAEKEYIRRWHRIDYFEDKEISIVQVVVGSKHSLFLSAEGAVYSCGGNRVGQLGIGCNDATSHKYTDSFPFRIAYFEENDIQIVKIACGWLYNAGLDVNGRVYTWGFNKYGQCGVGVGSVYNVHAPMMVETLKDEIVVDIVCGTGSLCALTVDGECWIWGKNNKYQCCTGETDNMIIPVCINKYLHENKIIKQISIGYCCTMMLLCDEC